VTPRVAWCSDPVPVVRRVRGPTGAGRRPSVTGAGDGAGDPAAGARTDPELRPAGSDGRAVRSGRAVADRPATGRAAASHRSRLLCVGLAIAKPWLGRATGRITARRGHEPRPGPGLGLHRPGATRGCTRVVTNSATPDRGAPCPLLSRHVPITARRREPLEDGLSAGAAADAGREVDAVPREGRRGECSPGHAGGEEGGGEEVGGLAGHGCLRGCGFG
jgi:hypothetical protein